MLTAHGVKPDETKVEAIKNYPKPTNKHDVQRLLGMVNFIAKFAPNISDVTAPLREFIKKNVAFHWLETHEKAFRDLQHLLTDPATLRYYDVARPVTLQVDTSQNGLGAAVIQNQGPVAYASKAMNDTQRRYAQIEKELLAVVFACKRSHQYVYGKTITVESDHKPLEAILKKNALSRAFPPEIIPEQFEEDIASERFIHLMSSESYVTDRKLQTIKDEIQTNATMQLLVQQIQDGWPDHKILVPSEVQPYYPYRQELTTEGGLIYKAHNILIPPSLRADTLQKLHQSHQGIEKTKRLARESIFWPGMNSQIEELVSNCSTCLHHANANQREPLHPHEIPSRPWQKVGTDLFEWNGKPHLIVVDYYSRYPKVSELRNTKARTVINKTSPYSVDMESQKA